MSTFRPVQPPQQPRQNFTPGQPPGTLAPKTDAQAAAYFRERREPTQPARYFTTPGPQVFVPANALQVPTPAKLEYLAFQFTPKATTGQPLGTPISYRFGQEAALLRPRIEIQQPTVNAPQAGPQTFVPFSALQMPGGANRGDVAIFAQPRPSATTGQPLGTPIAYRFGQDAALLRQRVEIPQPPANITQAAPQAQVPYTPVQMPQPAAKMDPAYFFETTFDGTDLPLDVVPGVKPDQTPAYWRQRIEIPPIPVWQTPGQPLGTPVPGTFQQQAAYDRRRQELPPAPVNAIPPTPAAQVGPTALQMPAAGSRADVAVLAQALPQATVGQPLGVPPPRTTDQTAALWRARIEIPQPVNGTPQAAPSAFVPGPTLQTPAPPTRSMIVEIEETLPYWTTGQPLGVPPPRTVDQTPAYWRARAETLQQPTGTVQSAAPQNVPASVLQMPFAASQRYEWLVELMQPTFTPPQAFVPSVAVQPLTARREEIQQPRTWAPITAAFVPAAPRIDLWIRAALTWQEVRSPIAALLYVPPSSLAKLAREYLGILPTDDLRLTVTLSDLRMTVSATDTRMAITSNAVRLTAAADPNLRLTVMRSPFNV